MLSIDLAAIMAGSAIRGQFEEKFKNLLRDMEEEVGYLHIFSNILNDISQGRNIICFIDEVRTCFCFWIFASCGDTEFRSDILFNLGKAEGSIDAGQMIKPSLARGLQLVGATTRRHLHNSVVKHVNSFHSRRIQKNDRQGRCTRAPLPASYY